MDEAAKFARQFNYQVLRINSVRKLWALLDNWVCLISLSCLSPRWRTGLRLNHHLLKKGLSWWPSGLGRCHWLLAVSMLRIPSVTYEEVTSDLWVRRCFRRVCRFPLQLSRNFAEKVNMNSIPDSKITYYRNTDPLFTYKGKNDNSLVWFGLVGFTSFDGVLRRDGNLKSGRNSILFANR